MGAVEENADYCLGGTRVVNNLRTHNLYKKAQINASFQRQLHSKSILVFNENWDRSGNTLNRASLHFDTIISELKYTLYRIEVVYLLT